MCCCFVLLGALLDVLLDVLLDLLRKNTIRSSVTDCSILSDESLDLDS